jgi:hypothetical protein
VRLFGWLRVNADRVVTVGARHRHEAAEWAAADVDRARRGRREPVVAVVSYHPDPLQLLRARLPLALNSRGGNNINRVVHGELGRY